MPGGKACHRPTIILLVKEKAGLLPVFKVYMVVYAVFTDLGLGGFRVALAGQGKPAFVLFQPLLGTQGFIVALIDAVNGLSVCPQYLGQQGVAGSLLQNLAGIWGNGAVAPLAPTTGPSV
jgi:hypothetical protein